jgi:hypothetical protein
MNYTEELIALKKRLGRTFTVDDWRATAEKSAEELTDEDIVIIGAFGSPRAAAEARKRRAQALARVRQTGVFSQQAYELAVHRKDSAPLDLTAADFDQLAAVSPDLERQARDFQRAAQLAIIEQRCTKALPAPAADDDETLDLVEFCKKYSKRPMTVGLLGEYHKLVRDGWDRMNEKNRQRNAKIAALESRLTALERKPFVKFAGTFVRGQSYEAGAAVVHKSGLWICKVATSGAPGEDFVAWQLALKKGDAQ